MIHVAYIALGSNLGDRQAAIDEAVAALRRHPAIQAVRISSMHETQPEGGPPGQDLFLNAAARLDTTLEARPLLDLLLEIERRLGRERRERWGPRIIDLDLLLLDREVINTPGLIVPHPLMHERRFVLAPLAEIAPDAVHPVLGHTVAELLAAR